jgi:hypothetical protein
VILCYMLWQGAAQAGQPGFFDRDERHAALSSTGDSLARLAMVVDFELFRPALERSDRSQGRPAAVRRGVDVQGVDAADAVHALG